MADNSLNIVVVNDDGWGTAGVRLLAQEMAKIGRVYVIAPEIFSPGIAISLSATSF